MGSIGKKLAIFTEIDRFLSDSLTDRLKIRNQISLSKKYHDRACHTLDRNPAMPA
jgi:hypothetical protein